MEYLNIPANAFRSPEFIGADPVQRGTWIALMGWCASQENGGRIPHCRGWKDRMWQQLVGVTAEEVMQDCDLWQWDGDDLVLTFYPVEQEQALRLKRDGNAVGGKTVSEAKSTAARENGRNGGRPRKNPTETQLETQAPPPETQLEPNVKEGKEKESKGRGERAGAHHAPPPLSPVNLLPVDRVRAELATVFPSAPRHMTAGEQHDLFGSLSVLDELTAEDWQACRGWVTCPDRVRGRKLWPRDRAEFVANAGQAVESIRQWWKTDGRSWWNRSQGNPPRKSTLGTASTTTPVGDVIEDPAEALAFFRSAPAKPAPQSVAVA